MNIFELLSDVDKVFVFWIFGFQNHHIVFGIIINAL